MNTNAQEIQKWWQVKRAAQMAEILTGAGCTVGTGR